MVLGIDSAFRERKREGGRGGEEGDMRVMWGGKGGNFMFLFWEKEREEEEGRRGEGG